MAFQPSNANELIWLRNKAGGCLVSPGGLTSSELESSHSGWGSAGSVPRGPPPPCCSSGRANKSAGLAGTLPVSSPLGGPQGNGAVEFVLSDTGLISSMPLPGGLPREQPEMDLNGLDVYQQGPWGPTSVEGGGNRIGPREKVCAGLGTNSTGRPGTETGLQRPSTGSEWTSHWLWAPGKRVP